MEWVWKKRDWNGSDGGAYAKLFQGKGSVEDIVAREVTQNSWDAAERLKSELRAKNDGSLPEDYRFKMVYEFKDIVGREKENLIAGLRLNELSKRMSEYGTNELDFQEGATCLDHLKDSSPIRCLYIHDYGAAGLRGDPSGDEMSESDFYRAFGQIGGNDRRTGGGSFGFGKSAFIKASKVRCVIAYTSFAPTPEDPVKTRLMGFAFWKGHKSFAGFAQLGALVQDPNSQASPLCDKQADEVAKALGFNVRNSDKPSDTGTSLLIIDQVLDAGALQESLEKFWWPAIETYKSDFDVQIHTDTEVIKLRPMQREYLRPFIRSFEIAADNNAQLLEDLEYKKGLQDKESSELMGNLAVVRVIDPVSTEALTTSNASNLIALIRNPRMVVQYQPHGNNVPIVQGVFVAEDTYDEYLRSSEPGAHDIWDTKIDESHGRNWQKTKKVVNQVQTGIRSELLNFQKRLRPLSVVPPDSLEFADELMAEIFEPKDGGTSKKKSKKPMIRNGAIATSQPAKRERILVNDSEIKFQERFTWELLKDAKDKTKVRVVPNVWVLADGSDASSSDKLGIKILDCPPEFKIQSDGSVVGIAIKGVEYTFEYETVPYQKDWNVRPGLNIENYVDPGKADVK